MKLVIFDIDGTLADTKKVDDSCFINAFYSTFQIDIQEQNWEDITHLTDWGITEEIIQKKLNRNPTEAEYTLMENTHIANLAKAKIEDSSYFKEIRGAKKFYNLLQMEQNIAIGIATGAWEKSALIKLSAIDINPANVPFSNSNYFKTREQITTHTIEQAREKQLNRFDEIIYFGDGIWDYKTCQNLGIRFIGIDVLQDNKLKQIGATAVFEDFRNVDELLNLIRG